jgi:peroxiredoxin family protein
MAERLAIIATKGTLDMAYPPLILASTAASLGVETAIFFTFYGLNIIHKQKMNQLKIAPIANPAMPMAFPPSMQNPITNAISSVFPGPPQIMGIIPGMTDLMSYMMKKTIKEHGVADIPELLEACKEAGVKLIPCQMTMELFGYKYEDLIDGLESPAGAAALFNYVLDSEKPMIIFV